MIAELESRIARLEATLNNVVRVGTVTQIAAGKVRVQFSDADQLVSAPLPVLFPKTHLDRFCAMPDVGEHVVCIFLPFGLEQGFVLGALYSATDAPPVQGADKWHLAFNDGSWLEFNRAASVLNIHSRGDVNIFAADKITLDGGSTDLSGVITGLSICHFTGLPHADASANVEASKGD